MSQRQKDPESAEDARERQHERNLEQLGHQNALQRAEDVRSDLIETLSQTDISEGKKEILRNYISKDFVLAYFREAEVHEMRFMLEVEKDQYYSIFPGNDAIAQGATRAWINDDPSDTLMPISPKERRQIESFFDAVKSRITRARNMEQQKIAQTSITETRRRVDEEKDTDDGLL